MDVNTAVTMISSVGFPIVACFYMAWNGQRESERHQAEMEKFSDAINNNTLVMTKLCERLGLNEDS